MNAAGNQTPKGWDKIEGDATVVTLPDPIDEFLASRMDLGELRMSDEAIAALDAGPDPLMRDDIEDQFDGSFLVRQIPRVDLHLDGLAKAIEERLNLITTEHVNNRNAVRTIGAYAEQLRMIAADLRRMFPHPGRTVSE